MTALRGRCPCCGSEILLALTPAVAARSIGHTARRQVLEWLWRKYGPSAFSAREALLADSASGELYRVASDAGVQSAAGLGCLLRAASRRAIGPFMVARVHRDQAGVCWTIQRTDEHDDARAPSSQSTPATARGVVSYRQ